MASNHALVFGATGIQGWAVVNQLLHDYPKPSSFSKITALTNRPIPKDQILWPSSSKLQTVSGIDLLDSNLAEELRRNVPSIETVTHIFFFAYIFKPVPEDEIAINVALLKNAITALESLAPNLVSVILPTGTKAYGVHLLSAFPFSQDVPLKESLPRMPEPFASQNFYYNQLDFLIAESKAKKWTFTELRPDVVIGYVPNNNFYSLAQILSTFLALFREINGEGAECAFPGTAKSWKNLSNDGGQDEIAKFAIFAALHPERCGGEAFNVASHRKPSTWEKKWPVICEFFGLKGVGPVGEGEGKVEPGNYLAARFDEWKQMEEKYGLVTGRVGNERTLQGFEIFIMAMMDSDRQLDFGKLEKTWGEEMEESDSKQLWWSVFQRYRDAKIIP